ncbi:MAG: protein phosphatase 2C domain-containing protein [Rhizomicrobium sp.]
MTDSRSLYFAGGQILGRRERQEDDYGAIPLDAAGDRMLLALADGMGGHAGGAEAAQTAIRAFLEAARRDAPISLEQGLRAANEAIANLTQSEATLEGAGCTLIGAVIEDGALSWISVGDSSLLLLRGGKIERLNEDHSMRPVLAEMVEVGRLDPGDAERHPNRNALRSALTGEDIPLIDVHDAFKLRSGDQVLIASDGLDVLDHAHIAKLLKQFDGRVPEDAVAGLLAEIETVGAPRQDNATVVLYRNQPTRHRSTKRKRRSWSIAIVLTPILGVLMALAVWFAMGGIRDVHLFARRGLLGNGQATPIHESHESGIKAPQNNPPKRRTTDHAKAK